MDSGMHTNFVKINIVFVNFWKIYAMYFSEIDNPIKTVKTGSVWLPGSITTINATQRKSYRDHCPITETGLTKGGVNEYG